MYVCNEGIPLDRSLLVNNDRVSTENSFSIIYILGWLLVEEILDQL